MINFFSKSATLIAWLLLWVMTISVQAQGQSCETGQCAISPSDRILRAGSLENCRLDSSEDSDLLASGFVLSSYREFSEGTTAQPPPWESTQDLSSARVSVQRSRRRVTAMPFAVTKQVASRVLRPLRVVRTSRCR